MNAATKYKVFVDNNGTTVAVKTDDGIYRFSLGEAGILAKRLQDHAKAQVPVPMTVQLSDVILIIPPSEKSKS